MFHCQNAVAIFILVTLLSPATRAALPMAVSPVAGREHPVPPAIFDELAGRAEALSAMVGTVDAHYRCPRWCCNGGGHRPGRPSRAGAPGRFTYFAPVVGAGYACLQPDAHCPVVGPASHRDQVCGPIRCAQSPHHEVFRPVRQGDRRSHPER